MKDKNKCDYKVNKTDEFTKDIILETKGGRFTASGLFYGSGYSLKKINGIKYLKFGIAGPSIFTLEKDGEIMFKTDEDKIITLKFTESMVADYVTANNITIWGANNHIQLTDDIYERFLNETIVKMRVYTSEGYIDDDIKSKHLKKFKEQLKCIE